MLIWYERLIAILALVVEAELVVVCLYVLSAVLGKVDTWTFVRSFEAYCQRSQGVKLMILFVTLTIMELIREFI